jgi:hypothetical protein
VLQASSCDVAERQKPVADCRLRKRLAAVSAARKETTGYDATAAVIPADSAAVVVALAERLAAADWVAECHWRIVSYRLPVALAVSLAGWSSRAL